MKKLIVTVLGFWLMGFSANLAAKEGAKVKIQKKDGQQLIGELIGVKDRTLVLIDGSGVYVSSAIDEASSIIIGNKGKFWNGAIPGFLLGAIGGALVGSTASGPSPSTADTWSTALAHSFEREVAPVAGGVSGGLIGGALGATIGGMIASSASGSKAIFRIEGKSQVEVQVFLEKLRSKARFPDYQ